jgi:hypothetical protein
MEKGKHWKREIDEKRGGMRDMRNGRNGRKGGTEERRNWTAGRM